MLRRWARLAAGGCALLLGVSGCAARAGAPTLALPATLASRAPQADAGRAAASSPADVSSPATSPPAAASSPSQVYPRPQVATAHGAPVVSVTRLTPQAAAAGRDVPSPDGRTVAVIDASGLHVGGRTVAPRAGAVVWSNDSRVLFYTGAPPVDAPTTEEKLYAVPVETGVSTPLGETDDPWRLDPTGAESVAFDDGGVLAFANAIGPTVVTTQIPLAQTPAVSGSAYPFDDSDFLVSANMRYTAVLTPQNHVEMFEFGRGGDPALPGTGQALPGTVAGDRQQWGAWTQDGTRFLYAVQTSGQSPRLEVWTAGSGSTAPLGGALAPSNRGEFLVLGWIARRPGTFLAEYVSTGAPRWIGGLYFAGQTDGTMQKLWTNGLGGTLAADDSGVTFAWSPTPQAPMQTWVASLQWG